MTERTYLWSYAQPAKPEQRLTLTTVWTVSLWRRLL